MAAADGKLKNRRILYSKRKYRKVSTWIYLLFGLVFPYVIAAIVYLNILLISYLIHLFI